MAMFVNPFVLSQHTLVGLPLSHSHYSMNPFRFGDILNFPLAPPAGIFVFSPQELVDGLYHLLNVSMSALSLQT